MSVKTSKTLTDFSLQCASVGTSLDDRGAEV